MSTDLVARLHAFLKTEPYDQDPAIAAALVNEAIKEINGLWYLIQNQYRAIISASQDLQTELNIEKQLTDELFAALNLMCTNRGIKPEDLDPVCNALENYDRNRKQDTRATYLRLEES